jgi:hypothetical protein
VSARSLAGWVLVLLATVSALAPAGQGPISHPSARHQWRAGAPDHGPTRAGIRHVAAVPEQAALDAPVSIRVGAVALPRHFRPPLPTSIFVPPRV